MDLALNFQNLDFRRLLLHLQIILLCQKMERVQQKEGNSCFW